MRARLAAVALGTAGLAAGCVSLAPAPPADWDPNVRAHFPPSVVAIDAGTFARPGLRASGVVLHSSKEHGTLVLTSARAARRAAKDGSVRVHALDPEKGTRRELEAVNYFPGRGHFFPEAADKAPPEPVGGELALLEVRTQGAKLVPARLEPRSVDLCPAPFVVPTLFPERKPRLFQVKDRPAFGAALVETDAPREVECDASPLFDGDGRLCGFVRHEGDEPPRASLADPDLLVLWLERAGVARWITQGTAIDAAPVARAAAAMDHETLRTLAFDREGVRFSVRASAVEALGRAERLEAEDVEKLVKGDPEPTVRRAALEAELARHPQHGDVLAAGLLASAERAHVAAAAEAVGRSSAQLPRSTEALEGLARARVDVQARTWGGAALVRRGAPLGGLPSELRAPVLAVFLEEIGEQPADEGPLAAVCERLARRAHAEGVVIDEGLGESAALTASLPAGLGSPAERIRRAFEGTSHQRVAVRPTPDGTRVSVALAVNEQRKDESP